MRWLLLILIVFLTATLVKAQRGESVRKKISPSLLAHKPPADKKQEQVFWITGSNIELLKNFLHQKKLPVKILAEYPNTHLLIVQLPWQMIDSLLPAPMVQFVEIPRKPKEELALGAYDISLNGINVVHNRLPQINGKDLVVSVKENEFNVSDIDLRGRYLPTPLGSGEISPHATIMATLIAGGGNSFYTGKGAAWGATLSTSSFASLLPDADAGYRQFNISVQNHSYGTGIENYYGADAAAYDATVISNPSLLHIFSAGNSGNEASTSGKYSGIPELANLTGSFKMAKNILTVGALDSFAAVAPLSSKGPAYDGRVKPELMAFGQDGSSGAAATTSGIALLLQQAYKEMNNDSLPPAALLKATLINTADDLESEGPDYNSGFGNVNAYKAINTILQKHYFSGSSATGTTRQFDITIPAGIRTFSVTLCWSDPPATANADRALINDLDITVQELNSGTTWQPWVLSSFPHKDSLLLPARRTRDSLNNVEKITIDVPAAGNYRLSVHGYSVPSGPQAWFACWRSDTADRFTWNYPTASDKLPANEKNILRWSSTFDNTTTGKIEYSTDNGNTWSLIGNANLQTGFYSWQAPDLTATVLFRMTIGTAIFVSDTSTLSRPPDLRVGFDCPDSVLLFWDPVSGVDQYRLWKLGDHYLEPFATVSDTLIVLGKTGNFFSVEPVISSTHTGIKTNTVDYELQGVGCYVKNFLADLIDDQSALLSLELGTLYNVKELFFEKLNGNTFSPLQTTIVNGNLSYNFTDNHLHKGANTYRAAIVLQSGQINYSQPETLFYFDTAPYLIFPNPSTPHTPLQIHSPDLAPRQFILYNSNGQPVLKKQLTEVVSNIPLTALTKGVYFIMIVKEGKKDYSGSLVIQ